MEIVLLDPDDAEYVEDIANHHYPANYPMSYDDILENLERSDQESFCYGVEDKGKLVGYLMAWVDNSQVEGSKEKVILIDDVVLSAKARHQIFGLIETMIETMESRGLGKLPIEGSARPTTSSTFLDHSEAMERIGYALTSKAEFFEDQFQESLTWLRFEPIIETDSVIDEDDYLEIDFEDNVDENSC